MESLRMIFMDYDYPNEDNEFHLSSWCWEVRKELRIHDEIWSKNNFKETFKVHGTVHVKRTGKIAKKYHKIPMETWRLGRMFPLWRNQWIPKVASVGWLKRKIIEEWIKHCLDSMCIFLNHFFAFKTKRTDKQKMLSLSSRENVPPYFSTIILMLLRP